MNVVEECPASDGAGAALNAANLLSLEVRRRFAASRRAAWEACGAFEWVAFGYLGISGAMIAIFHRHLSSAALHLSLRAGIITLILMLAWATRRWPTRAIQFARHWYPQLLFLFCFEELHSIVHLIFPGWFDRYLIAFDLGLTGVNPTVWLQQFARPGLNDFMQMAYLSYFFYLVVLGAILYWREEHRSFWTVMTASIAAYSMGYVIALLFPIESPYHALRALHTVELRGGFFTALVGLIERFGRVHGGAFPSAHVAGSFVALLGAWHYRRRLFWAFLPFFACMLVATLYGCYHYVADVLAGLMTGATGWWMGLRLMRLPHALPACSPRTARD